MMKRIFLNGRLTFATAAAITLLAVTTSVTADNKRRSDPLVLQEQGSFFIGGSIEFRDPNSTTPSDARFIPGNIAINHMYVEYQIPKNQKYKYPVLMMHGGGHTGKTYETTPDGREGWFTSFTRRGFSPFVLDAPNRGRTGYDPTQIYRVRLGFDDISTLPLGNIYSEQAAWIAFRFGPSYGVQYPGQQFPIAHVPQYIRQLVPSYRDAAQNSLIEADIVALMDQMCPCILIGHSTGGRNVLFAALQRPNLVKGLIGVEPAGFPAAAAAGPLAAVPMVLIVGDNTSPANTQAFTDNLRNLGGDASTIFLPNVGIHGNGHMMMMERNSEQIANLVEQWINGHVPSVRGHYKKP